MATIGSKLFAKSRPGTWRDGKTKKKKRLFALCYPKLPSGHRHHLGSCSSAVGLSKKPRGGNGNAQRTRTSTLLAIRIRGPLILTDRICLLVSGREQVKGLIFNGGSSRFHFGLNRLSLKPNKGSWLRLDSKSNPTLTHTLPRAPCMTTMTPRFRWCRRRR